MMDRGRVRRRGPASLMGDGRGDLYRVDFMGRKTMYKGPCGMWRMYGREIVMDRAIKVELIQRARGFEPDPR